LRQPQAAGGGAERTLMRRDAEALQLLERQVVLVPSIALAYSC
jgi:hypothetical protein